MARTPGAGAAERRRRHDVDSFDRRAGSYDRDWRSAFHHAVVTGSAVVAREAVPAPAAILDVGCGRERCSATSPRASPAIRR
jgi:hypothetical protein